MALNFPTSPATNDVYTAEGTTWVFNGTGWIRSLTTTASGGVWGTITGTLSDQTDLQAALDAISSSGVADGDKGSITVSSGGTVWTIDSGAVTNDMLAGSIALSKLATDPLARANHTGTQAHTTITGLGTLATQNGTFSGTSSGTNTGDQTSVTGNAGTATGDLTDKGFGILVEGTAVKLIAHNGSAQVEAALGTLSDSSTVEIAISSDGLGNVKASMTGGAEVVLAGGPTTEGTSHFTGITAAAWNTGASTALPHRMIRDLEIGYY